MLELNVTLTGLDAFYYLLKKHDWNIFVPDYNRISVIAYRQRWNKDGYVEPEYRFDIGISFDMSLENHDLIATLLGDEAWERSVWIDHDEWVGSPELTDPIVRLYQRNEGFRNWFQTNIIDYEMEVC